MDIEKMREKFEAWWTKEHGNKPLYDYIAACYQRNSAELCWIAWQASHESLVIELPDPHPDCNPNYREGIEDCAAAIKAAGLKVKL